MLFMTGSNCAEHSMYAVQMPSHQVVLYKQLVHQGSREDGDRLLMEY